jgi:hypothetical protein
MLFVSIYLVVAAVTFAFIVANFGSFNIGNSYLHAAGAALLWPMFITSYLQYCFNQKS